MQYSMCEIHAPAVDTVRATDVYVHEGNLSRIALPICGTSRPIATQMEKVSHHFSFILHLHFLWQFPCHLKSPESVTQNLWGDVPRRVSAVSFSSVYSLVLVHLWTHSLNMCVYEYWLHIIDIEGTFSVKHVPGILNENLQRTLPSLFWCVTL